MYKILANTLFLGKNLVFVPECHSTNTLALELCQQSSIAEGTLIITNKQLAGRGQRGNTWESEPGRNLTCSLILKPTFLAINDQFFLNIVASLAVRDYLVETLTAAIHIKWPNDILVNDLKVCGILIENQLQANKFTHAVLGIGLNINQQHFSSSSATSLSLLSNQTYDLQSVLEGVLSKVESRYLQLRQNHLNELRQDYLKSMYRLNEIHIFKSDQGQFNGKILGVDEQGRLRVSINGEEKVFGLKEISFAV